MKPLSLGLALFLVLLSLANAIGAIFGLHGPWVALHLAVAIPVAGLGIAALLRLSQDEATLARFRLVFPAGLFLALGLVYGAWIVDPVHAVLSRVSGPEPELPAPTFEITRAPSPLLPPGPERLPHVPVNVLELISAGQAMLTTQRLDIERCAGRFEGIARCLCDYKLAVTDAAGTITIVDAYENQPSNPPGYSVSVVATPGYERACGTNPMLDVKRPPGQTVLAVRTVVRVGRLSVDPMVFTPFSEELNLPELRQTGLEYWWDAVLSGQEDLRLRGVKSKKIPRQLVTDLVPPEHVFLLGIIENIGAASVFRPTGSEAARLRELHAVLVFYGIHGKRTFSWRVSKDVARGPLQIIPSTYDALAEEYPEIDLPESHLEGANDHTMAVRAAFVHTDNEWWSVVREEDRAHRDFLLRNPWSMKLFMAAGYNRSVGKIDITVHACKERWRDADCEKPLPIETRDYLYKYEVIDAMLFDPIVHAQLVQNNMVDVQLTEPIEEDTDVAAE